MLPFTQVRFSPLPVCLLSPGWLSVRNLLCACSVTADPRPLLKKCSLFVSPRLKSVFSLSVILWYLRKINKNRNELLCKLVCEKLNSLWIIQPEWVDDWANQSPDITMSWYKQPHYITLMANFSYKIQTKVTLSWLNCFLDINTPGFISNLTSRVQRLLDFCSLLRAWSLLEVLIHYFFRANYLIIIKTLKGLIYKSM